MNKKFKKALYMLGFALPIVAIPIITVACGTQTSQNTPNDAQKEADKNQNERTPKQETPIQDENKKIVVSSSLSSSKIYDENLLNSDVVELFKLLQEKVLEKAVEKAIEKAIEKVEELFDEDYKINEENIINNEAKNVVKELEKLNKFKASTEAKEKIDKATEEFKKVNSKDSLNKAKNLFDQIKDFSHNKIINLYKKIFSIETSGNVDFNTMEYNDFLSKFSEVKLINFFNIENLKKYLENLTDDNKLNEIALKDIFNTNINNVIESFKSEDKQIKQDFENNKQKNKIIELLDQNNPDLSNKIKDKLSNLTNFESFKSLLKDLIFSDLFDATKLQEKLN